MLDQLLNNVEQAKYKWEFSRLDQFFGWLKIFYIAVDLLGLWTVAQIVRAEETTNGMIPYGLVGFLASSIIILSGDAINGSINHM